MLGLPALTSALGPLIDLLEMVLLLTALLITLRGSIKKTLTAYRWQSAILAAVTGLTALQKWLASNDPLNLLVVALILLIVLLPASLAWGTERLLVRATFASPGSVPYGVWAASRPRPAELPERPPFQDRLGALDLFRVTPAMRERAARIWQATERPQGSRFGVAAVFIALVALAFAVAFQIVPGSFSLSDRTGLMVSLSLHLVGLYNLGARRDMLSQVVGLLVMDQGLYLAVVKIVAVPVPATFFVLALYFYTLITLVILFFLLPLMSQFMQTIDLDNIKTQSKLKG